jgi:hypothetical protein
MVDEAVVLDNSGLLKGGHVVWSAEKMPEWVQRLAAPTG